MIKEAAKWTTALFLMSVLAISVHAEEPAKPADAKSAPAIKADAKSEEKKVDAPKAEAKAAKPDAKAKKEKAKMVELKTNKGRIVIELDEAKAPISVKNFLQYVNDKHYNGTIFHRVIGNFMIQGGGMDDKMKEKPSKKPIKNEAANGLSNLRGTIAMARTNIVDSAAAQFFINVVDNKFLDHVPNGGDARYGYAVFGKVVEGMDVVDKIKAVPTGTKGQFADVPIEPVIIESAKAL